MSIPNNYDPHTQGWYLLPVEAAEVPLSLASTTGLTVEQINELNSHTIQGLIELVYVRVGNDVLYGGLNGLDVAIDKTSRTLELLSALQELHNSILVSSLGSFSAWFEFAAEYTNTDKYQSVYNSVASAFFGVPIFPDFIFASDDATVTIKGEDVTYEEFSQKLRDVQQQLRSGVADLLTIDPSAEDDQNSLYRTTLQVLCDLPPVVTGDPKAIAFTDAKLWALDYYTIDDGKDWAQNSPKQTVIKITTALDMFVISLGDGDYRAVSLSPGRQLGLGTGYLTGNIQIGSQGGPAASIRVGPTDTFSDRDAFSIGTAMPAQSDGNQTIRTMYLTFSGRMAIGSATVFALNPMNKDGDVHDPLQSGYLGSFGERGNMGQLAGSLQQNITTAITAAQGLNTEQQESVQSFLFTFQEYYKSASALLNSITQIVEKFAQNERPA
ncbi:MAG: hypothetical protein VX777_08035 [Chlamydiota bacterium]|nr:hypothetical protein [Chlamydiota bacterium]